MENNQKVRSLTFDVTAQIAVMIAIANSVANIGWFLITDIEQQSTQEILALIVVQTICFLGTLWFAAKFLHKKLSPIKGISAYMHDIAQGNLQSKLDHPSNDELGSLVNDIHTMIDTLFTYINHVSTTVTHFSQGKIYVDRSVEYIGDYKPVYDSMVAFEELMTVSLSELKEAVKEVGTGAIQISNGAGALANGSQEQASSIEQMNHLITTIDREISETANYSNKISDYASSITGNILTNNDKMKNLATNVQEIKNHSNEVSRIIKVIEDVAFQTNILALNAAVEAARAGESGRGFAVVADEVRNLSIRTSEAVRDTSRIITEMEIFVTSSADLAHDTSGGLQHIVDEAQDFVQNMSNITHSTNDQSQAINNIHRGMEQISHVVHQNAAISEESSAATEELSTQAQLMSNLIEKFNFNQRSF
ncbi:MAG: HAMP domain-containing methyl-accepting chemotaxis protein [Eubacteriales bacterium]